MRVGWFCTEKRGWVGSKNAFFEFFLRRLSTTQPPALPVYPAGGDHSPQRTRNDCTRQAKAQGVPDAEQSMQYTAHTPGRWTRCTGLHSIPDRPRRDNRTGRGALDCLRIVSETVQIWTQRSGSKIYLIFEYICCACNRKPLYSVSKV